MEVSVAQSLGLRKKKNIYRIKSCVSPLYSEDNCPKKVQRNQ